MAKFHQLKVADIRRETADCVSVAFEIPENLKAEYQYVQGQYVTIKMNHSGEEIRRSYSLCSSPVADQDFRVAAKKVKDGRMSVYLNEQLKVGDVLEVMSPMGNFFNLTSAENKNIILFAGGSGITPMLSIVKTLLKSSPSTNLTLFYGNQNEAAIIFKDELSQIASANNNFSLYNILDDANAPGDELYKGLITKEKVAELVKKHVDMNSDVEFFICGPTPMMKNVEESLAQLNVAKERVHLEYFTASLEAAKDTLAENSEKIVAQVTVLLDGDETTFELASDGKNILDAAMDQDLDVPFSCKGAVCCTCRAKVLEGKVHMKANYALTEEEVAEGFVLTCQSHPLTAKVVVDYDV